MSKDPVVYIVDDDQAIRTGITDLVVEMGFEAQAFGSAEEFLRGYDPDQPGCLILDVRMPGMDGLELQAKLVNQEIGLPIIIVTGHGDVPMSVQALKMGAVDFIEKPFRGQVLWESIKQAVTLATELRQVRANRRKFEEKLALLSTREREVMEMLREGKTDKQIAQELDIAIRTVAFHRAHILQKVQIDTVVDLARLLAKWS